MVQFNLKDNTVYEDAQNKLSEYLINAYHLDLDLAIYQQAEKNNKFKGITPQRLGNIFMNSNNTEKMEASEFIFEAAKNMRNSYDDEDGY